MTDGTEGHLILLKIPSQSQFTVRTTVSMDPGTILAIVTTSATILSHITKYYSDVKNAKQDRERLYREVKALHHVLKNVQNLVEGPNASKVLILSSYMKESCFSDIEYLEIKLDPGKREKSKEKARYSRFTMIIQ